MSRQNQLEIDVCSPACESCVHLTNHHYKWGHISLSTIINGWRGGGIQVLWNSIAEIKSRTFFAKTWRGVPFCMFLNAIKKILVVLKARGWKYQWRWEDAWVILYRDAYIRSTLFRSVRIPRRNVFIEKTPGSIHHDLVIPIEVIHIRYVFEPKKTVYVCATPMLPLIPTKMKNEILWGAYRSRQINKKEKDGQGNTCTRSPLNVNLFARPLWGRLWINNECTMLQDVNCWLYSWISIETAWMNARRQCQAWPCACHAIWCQLHLGWRRK